MIIFSRVSGEVFKGFRTLLKVVYLELGWSGKRGRRGEWSREGGCRGR